MLLAHTKSMNQVLLYAVVTILGAIGANATCASGQYSLCCMGVAPYSSNSGVWGGICGFYPPDNPLVGARCIAYDPSSGWCVQYIRSNDLNNPLKHST